MQRIWRPRMFEKGPEFEALVDHPQVIDAVGPAGTAVLWHDQTWHRGAPNRSKDRTRWVQQVPYARRFIAQRFYPFVNSHLPEAIIERANPRRKRL